MRPTYLQVDLARLKQNLLNIRAHVGPSKVLAVVKANAYGHGVDGVAPYLAEFADYFGVAIVEEGIHLRQLGIRKPILVMGGSFQEQIPDFIAHDLTLTVGSLALLNSAERQAREAAFRLKVHLKIDTGMERLGVHEYEADALLGAAAESQSLHVEGIFSHFANSERHDLAHAKVQLDRFGQVLAFYPKHGMPVPSIRHIANSGAILQLPETHMDMVRPGVMLYGVYPGAETERSVQVETALTWYSRVVQIRTTRAGRPVSYGSLWSPSTDARVVTIPCGYADGYFRRMTNQSRVLINGALYPQVGRICMDQFMVDATGGDVGEGDEVILLGRSATGARITPEDLAAWAGTNEYEVLTNISARVPRVFVA